MESSFSVPVKLFTPEGQGRHEAGVTFAELVSKKLFGAVKAYYGALKQESAPTAAAQRHFWNALDRDSRLLLKLLRDMFTERDPMGRWGFGDRHEGGGFDPWTALVRKSVREAYDHVCPRQTPRQLQAYAAGWRVLFPKPTKKKTAHA